MADGPAPEPEPAGKLELQHVAGIWRAHGWIVPAGVVPGEEQDAPDPVEVVEWFEITARGTGAADDPPVALAGGAVAVAALGEARRRYSSRKSAAEKDEQAAPDEGVAAVSHTPQNGTIGGGPCADPPHHRRHRRRRPPARPPAAAAAVAGVRAERLQHRRVVSSATARRLAAVESGLHCGRGGARWPVPAVRSDRRG